MPHINDLPAEILETIFQNLFDPRQTKWLPSQAPETFSSNIGFVCQKWCNISFELYCRLTYIKWDGDDFGRDRAYKSWVIGCQRRGCWEEVTRGEVGVVGEDKKAGDEVGDEQDPWDVPAYLYLKSRPLGLHDRLDSGAWFAW
ncbi:hypothetical protein OHC33_004196 [Knufia fluminis]|uniref:F-box domain-containing protein n=1 Tax=Knufia fluminis TaxID=191047 RepID=A0AAN8EFI2_9EURO|nr:hypothetical protein OHC33_004196 [Knufia fluminis]